MERVPVSSMPRLGWSLHAPEQGSGRWAQLLQFQQGHSSTCSLICCLSWGTVPDIPCDMTKNFKSSPGPSRDLPCTQRHAHICLRWLAALLPSFSPCSAHLLLFSLLSSRFCGFFCMYQSMHISYFSAFGAPLNFMLPSGSAAKPWLLIRLMRRQELGRYASPSVPSARLFIYSTSIF